MKTKDKKVKLHLHRETLRPLVDPSHLGGVVGGVTGTLCSICNTRCTCGTRLC